MKRIKYLLFATVIGICDVTYAQELLTVKDAVDIALKNNYDIQLSKNNTAIASENLTYGNAGMLPTVTGNFTQNNSTQNSTQVQNTGQERSLKNAKNNSMNYGVSVGWTIFDGFGMFARYESLKELKKVSDLELKRMIVTQVSGVITTYYNIVEQQNVLAAMDSSILISRERMRTAENRFEIGKASRLEVLNAQVNLNTDESNRLRQYEVVKNLKIALNSLLVRDLQIDFEVVHEVKVDTDIKLGNLIEKAKIHNPELLSVTISKRLAELELKNVKANRYPTIRLNSGYNFSETESSLGFVAQSNSRGLTYGVTASINIFDGFIQRRNERISKIQVDNANLNLEKVNLQIETALARAYQTYQTNLALMQLEQSNEAIAKRNLEITLDKYKIGTISTVEFRDAQENYINAVSRNNAAKLHAKLSESLLKELVGEIDLVLE